MEELLELKSLLLTGDIQGALALVDELAEMDIYEGRYDVTDLAQRVDAAAILNQAMALIMPLGIRVKITSQLKQLPVNRFPLSRERRWDVINLPVP